MTEPQVWLVTTGEDYWDNGQEFPSRAEALAWGREDRGPNATLFTGRRAPIQLLKGGELGTAAIDALSESAYNQASDIMEHWPNCSDEQLAQLGLRLAEVVNAWVAECCPPTTLWRVVDVEEHRPTEEEDS